MINSIAIIILAISIIMVVWRVSKISKSVSRLEREITHNYQYFDRGVSEAHNKINTLYIQMDLKEERVIGKLNNMLELDRDITARKKYKLLKNDEVIYENTDLDETRKLMKTLAEADKFYKKEFEYEIQEVYVNEKSA